MPHGGLCRRAVHTWAVLLLCVLPAFSDATAKALLDPHTPGQRAALEGLEALYGGEPERANRLLTQFVRESPDDPLGFLLRMKLWWWGILEGRDTRGDLELRFQSDFKRLRDMAEQQIDEDPENVRALYALGEAYCTFGRLQGVRGHGWSTLRNHRKGAPLLERALELDPELVEPLASLGVYHYYASRAPGFLRFLARFLRVQADRRRGLQELWRAASVPGIQRGEAAFFLLEVLTNVEDELLAALPFALRFHARYPKNLGFTVSLASVQVGLGRPDLAVRLLESAVHDEDATRSIGARFFVARALCMSGRAAESVQLLEGFTPRDFASVSWLEAWHSYYLGLAYDQLGRNEEAHRAYEFTCAAPRVADSHGFAKREMSRRGERLHRVAREAEAVLEWGGDLESTRDRLLEVLDADTGADEDTERQALYALGVVALRLGDYELSSRALRRVLDADASEEAWLVVRPRVRLLQALLWGGRLDEARGVAVRLQPELGGWGGNRHLELLVQTCLQPNPQPFLFERELEPRPNERIEHFWLKDVGFTSVRLQRRSGRRPRSHAMRLREGWWEIEIPLAGGAHLYRFEIESGQPLLDPGELDVREQDGQLWSVRHVQPRPEW
ncbi:MAG: hypothetical protein ACE5G2_08375 [Candidatus Krumholzibacteriia bacterium]